MMNLSSNLTNIMPTKMVYYFQWTCIIVKAGVNESIACFKGNFHESEKSKEPFPGGWCCSGFSVRNRFIRWFCGIRARSK